jgi:hypothetical protein
MDTIAMRQSNKRVTEQQKERLTSIISVRSAEYHTIGRTSIYGNYKNFNVGIHPNTITVDGSLSEFVFGQNVDIIDFQQTKDALYQLELELGIPILTAQLVRLDMGECFFLDSSLIRYFTSLLPTPFSVREEKENPNHGVTYRLKKNELSFYNKTQYAITSPMVTIPDGKQVMRIEKRYKSNLRRSVLNNSRKLAVFHLLSHSFHKRMATLWCNHFDSIVKKRKIYEYPKMKGYKDYCDFRMASSLIEHSIEACFSELQIIAEENKWKTRVLTDLQNALLAHYNSGLATVPNRYIKELEREVHNGYIWQLAHQHSTID